MSLTLPWLRPAKHDPDTVIRRLRDDVTSLRDENVKLLNRKNEADDFFNRLTADRDDVYRCWHKAAADRDTAEKLADQYAQELQAQTAELMELRAFRDNATAVTVPPAERDVDPDDQPTQPIYVKTLREALGIGPVHAVTDPGHTAA